MKQLTCEMCGSKNLVKQDGLFVCQNCGTQYSVEEARKMMVEGTVQVDSSHLTGNYLSMAKNALDAGNNAEADSYCNKIIEVDPTAYEAWFIKGVAVGWESTLGNQRISETINAFSHALDNCPEDKKEELSQKCKQEIEKLHKALLTLRMQNFLNRPNATDVAALKSDVMTIVGNTLDFLAKSGVDTDLFGRDLGYVILKAILTDFNVKIVSAYKGDDGRPGDYAFRRFITEADCCIESLKMANLLFGTDENRDLELYEMRATSYETMVLINNAVRDGCSWDYNFTDWGKSYFKKLTLTDSAVAERNKNNREWEANAKKWRTKMKQVEAAIEADKKRKAQEEAKKRQDAYWAEHKEEKVRLGTEKRDLEKQISNLTASQIEQVKALKKEKAAIPGQVEIEALEEKIRTLSAEKDALGIFKVKEKKALQEKIDQVETEKKAVQDRMDAAGKEIEAKIDSANKEFNRKILPLQNRVNSIQNELTRAR